jgi:hypothetical protein
VNQEERWELLGSISPHIGAWFAMWFGNNAIYAKDVYHPHWWRIPYGAGLLSALNAAGRPYRYTMRRKVRRMYRDSVPVVKVPW